MAQLQILERFTQLFEEVYDSLKVYNNNLRNELFEVEPNEDNEKAYKRGETIYDRCEYDLKNIREIIEKKEQIDTFFRICQENEKKLNLDNEILNIKDDNKEESLEKSPKNAVENNPTPDNDDTPGAFVIAIVLAAIFLVSQCS